MRHTIAWILQAAIFEAGTSKINSVLVFLWITLSIASGAQMCDWHRGSCTHINDPCPPNWVRCEHYDNDCPLNTSHCCCRKPLPGSDKMCEWPRGDCTYKNATCPPNWERCAQYDNECSQSNTHCCCRSSVPGIWSVQTPANSCRASCDVDFETIGCFKEMPSNRALPYYISNERDPSIKNYGGRKIDWFNWNNYFTGFACRCAQKAKEMGYDLFGLQNYGECWAGYKDVHDYARYSKQDTDSCIGDDFQNCGNLSRYCVGRPRHSMVYKIVDATSCPEAPFEKVECYQDNHEIKKPLPDYLFNDLDPTTETFSGILADWRNWDIYLPMFACRCARAAKARNATFFGIQSYAQCWSDGGKISYDVDGLRVAGCVDQCNKQCKKHSRFCAGQNFANFVYKLKGAPCDINVTPVGCFKDDPNNSTMEEIFYSEKLPGTPNYGGNSLHTSQNYNADFPEFLCRCARYAKLSGWQYFGVKVLELGLCVRRTSPIYNIKYGLSSKCYEGNISTPCKTGSKLCAGLNSNASFVYQVKLG